MGGVGWWGEGSRGWEGWYSPDRILYITSDYQVSRCYSLGKHRLNFDFSHFFKKQNGCHFEHEKRKN